VFVLVARISACQAGYPFVQSMEDDGNYFDSGNHYRNFTFKKPVLSNSRKKFAAALQILAGLWAGP